MSTRAPLLQTSFTFHHVAIVLFLVLTSRFVIAEEPGNEDFSFEALQQVEITGMSTQDVVQTFGEPDSRSGPKAKETWHYGDTLVFISDGKVAAFVDSGELKKRKDHARFQKRPEEQNDPLELKSTREWKNDWTIAAPTPAEDVVDELLDTPSK